MERVIQDIKNNNFRHLYLLYGSESYLRLYYKNALKEKIIGDDTMNYNYYEGKEIDLAALIEQADTMPFFAEKRLIVIENSGLLKEGGEMLADYLEKMPDYLYIVMSEYETDMRSRLSKVCKKVGVAAEMKPYEGVKMKQWIAGILKKFGKKMMEKDIEYFLKIAGSDMAVLSREVDKLVNYTQDREIVTSEDVDSIVTRQIEDNIFKMISAMGNRKQREALDYYYDMLSRREAPMKILALIIRQFNLLLQTKELVAHREMGSTIASKIGVPSFFVKEYIAQSELYTERELRGALEACARADEDIKTGRMKDMLAVEILIVEYSK